MAEVPQPTMEVVKFGSFNVTTKDGRIYTIIRTGPIDEKAAALNKDLIATKEVWSDWAHEMFEDADLAEILDTVSDTSVFYTFENPGKIIHTQLLHASDKSSVWCQYDPYRI